MQTINITLSKEYFLECFQQSIRHANKWRKFERVLGVIFIISAIVFLIFSQTIKALPIVLLVIGILELFNPFIKKFFWLRRQMKSKIANAEAAITISENGINSESKFGNSSVLWSGVEKIVETPKGLLIWPQNGVHIYLPKTELQESTIQFILSKI